MLHASDTMALTGTFKIYDKQNIVFTLTKKLHILHFAAQSFSLELKLLQRFIYSYKLWTLEVARSERMLHIWWLLQLQKIQAICSHDLSQSFEIKFGRDKRVPLLPKVLS